MDSRERIFAAINGIACDRTPVVPQITYYTSDLGTISWERAMNAPEAMVTCLMQGFERFRYDGVYAGWESSFNLMAHALGASMTYRQGSIPYIDKPLFTQPQQIAKLQVCDPRQDDRLSLHLQTTELLRKRLPASTPIFSYVPGPLTVAGLVIDNPNLMKNILLQPNFVHDVVKITTQATIRYAKAKIDSGAEIIVIADPSASCSIISPDMFDQFSRPYLQEIVDKIHEHKAIASIHICGKIMPILESLCKLHPQIIEIDSENDLQQARNIVGNQVALQGNINPTATLLMGNSKQVVEESMAAIRSGSLHDSLFILSSGCEVPNGTPAENIGAMLHAANDAISQ